MNRRRFIENEMIDVELMVALEKYELLKIMGFANVAVLKRDSMKREYRGKENCKTDIFERNHYEKCIFIKIGSNGSGFKQRGQNYEITGGLRIFKYYKNQTFRYGQLFSP